MIVAFLILGWCLVVVLVVALCCADRRARELVKIAEECHRSWGQALADAKHWRQLCTAHESNCAVLLHQLENARRQKCEIQALAASSG